jgi:hypothetical protein
MPTVVQIPITNVYMEGDYTGQILVGPNQQPLNVILDTGSSALAIDGHKYQPNPGRGDKTTNIAQTDSYGDGSSWTGAVIETQVAVGADSPQVTVPDGNVAVTYEESTNMFGSADGILGLAYAPLDDAFQMAANTWSHQYSGTQVNTGKRTEILPYLMQLQKEGVASDIVSFYTKRSFIHAGGGGVQDPLNQGWMIIGGGEESTDLFTGTFQTVKVLADEWYNTNLKSITVNGKAIAISSRGPKGMPSNSIIDSGTNSLNLGPRLLKALFALFTSSQQQLLNASVFENRAIPNSKLQLETWPNMTFVLQGDTADVSLSVAASDYWQIDAGQVGVAMAAITQGQEGLAILGLPLMNGYFTIFDGDADGGKGAIRFATRR